MRALRRSIFLMSLADRYILYVFGAILLGLAYGIGTTAPLSLLIRRWFLSRRSTVFAICSSGSAISAIILPSVTTYIAQRYSLTAAMRVTALISLSILIVFSLLARENPQELGLHPYQEAQKEIENKRIFGQYVPSANLLLYVAIASMGGTTTTLYAHFTALLTTNGQTKSVAAACVSSAAVLLAFFKLFCGMASDRFGAYRTGMVSLFLMGIGSLLICLTGKSRLCKSAFL